MKYISFIFFCVTVQISVIAQMDTITGKRFINTIPVPLPTGTLIKSPTYDIYHQGSLTLYRITVDFDSSVNNVSLLHEKRYQYFVFEKDSVYGVLYSLVVHKELRMSRLSVDSVKSKNNIMINMQRDQKTFLDSSYSTGGDETTLVFKYKKNETYPEDFTHYFHYSPKFNGVAETLCPAWDTIDEKKLYKIILHGHGGYYKKQNYTMPARDYVYEMASVSQADLALAKMYFKKYLDYCILADKKSNKDILRKRMSHRQSYCIR